MQSVKGSCLLFLLSFFFYTGFAQSSPRTRESFNKGWTFYLGERTGADAIFYDDHSWRRLDLPHDWSIEGKFDKNNPAGTGGGALPGGIGWYRKTFTMPLSARNKNVFIDFDGIYRKSEVWINGHDLGNRPNGYISFRYDLGPWLKYGDQKNVIAVRVDNAEQPNSRWYSGSGIYRNVWLVTTSKVFVDHWGTYITTPHVDDRSATLSVSSKIRNTGSQTRNDISVTLTVQDATGAPVKTATVSLGSIKPGETAEMPPQELVVPDPHRWSVDDPYLYKVVTEVRAGAELLDVYTTPVGIRTFRFDIDKGFFLNDRPLKINGVCDHHDLGCLGTAINRRALERQLEILKAMGCNGIRTSHNPPAPELLDLADRMGFIVMDEAFDMWKRQKTKYDYHLDWDQWHKRDLEDQILRDRNHPCVFIWSIGNEIPEQWNKDSVADGMALELRQIVRSLDTTRPITSAINNHDPRTDGILRSGALDLVGFNYDQNQYPDFPKKFPGKCFLATETVSALATRGHYDMPSDTIYRWPHRGNLRNTPWGNVDMTCSSYDNCSAPWGSTQEETWKVIKKYDFLAGQFIWTGFDYIGEPTPYPWPARSSYFGIVDLAGFPKDQYYMYQSEWTDKPVLHLFPHWNWRRGDTVDVWAYYNQADEVELFLNGRSLGTKRKQGDDLHVWWRVAYEPGTIRAVSRKNGQTVLEQEISTAGKPAAIHLSVDHKTIRTDGEDLAFVTATIVDAQGRVVPNADILVRFSTTGMGKVIATDNGCETSMESFQSPDRKAFNGMCLAVIRPGDKPGLIQLKAEADGLQGAQLDIDAQ